MTRIIRHVGAAVEDIDAGDDIYPNEFLMPDVEPRVDDGDTYALSPVAASQAASR
jgi:hypothetical protein